MSIGDVKNLFSLEGKTALARLCNPVIFFIVCVFSDGCHRHARHLSRHHASGDCRSGRALTVVIPLVFGLGFKKMAAFRNFSALSLIFARIILVTGLTSALSINFFPALMGLFERLTLFGYLLYVFLLASKILKSNPAEF